MWRESGTKTIMEFAAYNKFTKELIFLFTKKKKKNLLYSGVNTQKTGA